MTRTCYGCGAPDKTIVVGYGDYVLCRICIADRQWRAPKPVAAKADKPRPRRIVGGVDPVGGGE